MASLFIGLALLLSQIVVNDQPSDEVLQVALETASTQLGLPIDNLVVVAWAEKDWPDTSLGCPVPGQAYAQIITSGYLLTVDADDGSTEVQVHTDLGSRGAIC